MSLARSTLNTRVANLDYLCRRFKVDLSERDLHGALLDSQLLAEVYLELKGGKQFTMNLSNTNSPETNIPITEERNDKNIVKFQLLEEDVVAHKKIVKEIKEAIWKNYNY